MCFSFDIDFLFRLETFFNYLSGDTRARANIPVTMSFNNNNMYNNDKSLENLIHLAYVGRDI